MSLIFATLSWAVFGAAIHQDNMKRNKMMEEGKALEAWKASFPKNPRLEYRIYYQIQKQLETIYDKKKIELGYDEILKEDFGLQYSSQWYDCINRLRKIENDTTNYMQETYCKNIPNISWAVLPEIFARREVAKRGYTPWNLISMISFYDYTGLNGASGHPEPIENNFCKKLDPDCEETARSLGDYRKPQEKDLYFDINQIEFSAEPLMKRNNY